jgi:hypothetical protein
VVVIIATGRLTQHIISGEVGDKNHNSEWVIQMLIMLHLKTTFQNFSTILNCTTMQLMFAI